jgi:hypothetical protein
MAESRSLTSLRSGVENYFQKVVRTVNAEKVGLWRSIVEGLWVRDMLSIQEREVPGFATWYSDRSHYPERPVPRLKAAKKQEFLKKTREPNWDLTLAFYCHRRALLSARKNQPTVADSVALETISNAIKSLSCYCGVYTQYIVRLLTKSALPAFNDSGDIELFLHAVDDDHIVVTSEKKWETMAENAGFGNRVRMAK